MQSKLIQAQSIPAEKRSTLDNQKLSYDENVINKMIVFIKYLKPLLSEMEL
jgi:hypothetical protein